MLTLMLNVSLLTVPVIWGSLVTWKGKGIGEWFLGIGEGRTVKGPKLHERLWSPLPFEGGACGGTIWLTRKTPSPFSMISIVAPRIMNRVRGYVV
jgi:hypothetical protein